jgi:glutathione S-transferase
MTLHLHFHPLSSFCMKALVALYEADAPFEGHFLDLSNEAERAAHLAMWPVGKMPVLRDDARGLMLPEATIVIEYLAQTTPGGASLVPADPALALEVRLRDRFYDLYVNTPMQKVVTDKLRPPGRGDPFGVDEARATLSTALDLVEREMATKPWAAGASFTMADCAAAPALFYADKVMPFAGRYERAAAYLARLTERPSFARALREAEPYMKYFPG